MHINWQSFLSKVTNDMHVPVALLVFGVTTYYHFHTGKDLGTNYINSLYAFYGFLAGHFGCSQKWPDPPPASSDNSNADSADGSSGQKG